METMEDVNQNIDESPETSEGNQDQQEVEVKEEVKEDDNKQESNEKNNKEIQVGDIQYTKNVEKRIGKITREKYELAQQVEDLKSKLQRFESKDSRPIRPNMKSYIDHEGNFDESKYNIDLGKYEDELFEWKDNKRYNKDSEIIQKAEADSRNEDFIIRAEKTRLKYSDFDQMMSKEIFSNVLIKELKESDPEVAYYLAKNENEAMKFNNMPYSKMVKEIGKLEEKISSLNKKTSNAPPPINPVDGDKGIIDNNNLSDEDWLKQAEKKRLDEIKKKFG